MAATETGALKGGGGRTGTLSPASFAPLALGVDNVRHDVCFSPRWEEAARQFLAEQLLHSSQPYLKGLLPQDTRRRSTAFSEFRTRLDALLREAQHRAKEQNQIEIELLARLGVIKWLLGDLQQEFAQLAVACKEQVGKHGGLTARTPEQAFLAQSRVADFLSNRRHVLNAVGEKLFQLFEELEEHSLRPARMALLGSAMPEIFQGLRNRLIFLENPNDAALLLDHYVMLGHFVDDPDDEDRVWGAVAALLREQGLVGSEGAEMIRLEEERGRIAAELQENNRNLREAERALDELPAGVAGREEAQGWFAAWARSKKQALDPEALRVTIRELGTKRERLTARLDELENRMAFLRQEEEQRFEQLLTDAGTADRIFGGLNPTGTPEPASAAQRALLQQLYSRLEQAGMLRYILASYHLRGLYREFCPPLNPQQLKHALVTRRGWDQFEALLDHFPKQDFPLNKLQDVSRRLRRLSRGDAEALLARFAHDFLRMKRDRLSHQLLVTLLEKIHLVADEKTRRVSQLNRTLHEFLLPEEQPAGEETVLTHVVVKADVRDSTGITDQLLQRGLNPATHFSFHFYEPVRKLMARYSASKIFIEGDALILGIYETESNRASHRPVAKACLLAKEIVQVCAVYNERARAHDLPVLDLGLGVAYHPAPPHYWDDGESRILISAALNKSDRLAGCTKVARKLLSESVTPFHVFLLQSYSVSNGSEEDEDLLMRYNVMGVALNEEGFRKLRAEISLTPVRMSGDLLGQKESITVHCGTVPLGESFEKLMVREARVPRILLPGGHIQEWTSRTYYEVCVTPEIYEKFPAAS
jgi:hypothetical protein